MLPILLGLLEELPVGTIVLDRHGRVVHYNRFEEELAQRKRENVLGKSFFEEVAPCMQVRELSTPFFEKIGRERLSIDTNFSFRFPHFEQPRDVIVRLRSFEADGAPYGALFVEDISHWRAVERAKATMGRLLLHDLKNPLAVATTSLEVMSQQRQALEAYPILQSLVCNARHSLHRLQGMLTNFVEVTRLQTQDAPLARTRTDLRALFRELAEQTDVRARTEGLTLSVRVPEQPCEAQVDAPLLRRAVENLIDNSLRYARSRLILRLEPLEDRLRIEVRDDGPGVAEELQDQVFEPSVRAAPPATGRIPNQGLGLTLVRLAARAHGGHAHCERTAENETVFRLDLPANPSQAPTQGDD